MKLLGTILFAVLLGASASPAQSPVQQCGASFGSVESTGPSKQTPHITMIEIPAFPNQCPVTLHAGHLADGSLVKTDGRHPKGIGQWLSLSFAAVEAKPIANATLVVHGLTPQAHVSRALSASGASAHTVRTFHVSFSPGSNRSSLANLWVPGMSAVERIDLLNVTYSDGSTWNVAGGQSCRVEPDMKMLITSR